MTPEDLRKAAEILEIAAHALNPPASTMMRLAAGLRAMADAEPVAWRYDLKHAGSFSGVSREYSPIKLKIGENWMPLYTTPQRPQWAGLTDWEVQEVVTSAVKAKKLSWLGFKKDNKGEYTIPALSPSDYQFATAIESALRAKNGGAA